VGVLGLVELQGSADAVEDSLGDAGPVPAFEPHVLGAHPGEQGDLFAAQPLHAASPEVGQARLGRSQAFTPRGQELAKVVPGLHGFEFRYLLVV
jgi:hypothetical protein